MKDKSYRAFPLGQEAAAYLRSSASGSPVVATATTSPASTSSPATSPTSSSTTSSRRSAPSASRSSWTPSGAQRAPRTYNKNLSILRDFFKWQVLPRPAARRPDPGDRARQAARRSTGPRSRPTSAAAIVAAQDDLRDRIALRLLLDYGLRKGALQGDPVQALRPPPQAADDLHEGREGPRAPAPRPGLLVRPRAPHPRRRGRAAPLPACRRSRLPRQPARRLSAGSFPDKPMGAHGLHDWWYRLPRNGRRRRRRARPAASGCTRPATPPASACSTPPGNLKAVQKLLGHASIQTTGDVYADWDIDQLAATMRTVLEDEE